MTPAPPGIEDHPYFRWRRDGDIQVTLGLAAASIFLACAGFDTIAAWQRGGKALGVHWLFLGVAGLAGGSLVLQFRFTVLVLRLLCGGACLVALLGLLRGPPELAVAALLGSLAAGGIAEWRMRGAHWAAFRAYCSVPEEVPVKPVKR